MDAGLIVEELYRLGPMANQELSQHFGLSPASFTKIIRGLVEEGLLKERPPTEFDSERLESPDRKKRRKVTYSPDPDFGYVVSCLVRGNSLIVRKVDFALGVDAAFVRELPVDEGDFPAQLAALLRGLRKEDARPILGLGLCVSGHADPQSGRLVFSNERPFLRGDDANRVLSEALSLPVAFCNDANALAICERFMGKARDMEHFFSLYIDEGVGIGIFTNGKIYEGYRKRAGESGHWILDPLGPSHPGAPRGSFESFVSKSAIQRALKVKGFGGNDPYETLADNPEARSGMLGIIVDKTALLCTNLYHVFAPQKIFLYGPLAELGEQFLTKLRKRIAELTLPERADEIGNAVELRGDYLSLMTVGTAKSAIDLCLSRRRQTAESSAE